MRSITYLKTPVGRFPAIDCQTQRYIHSRPRRKFAHSPQFLVAPSVFLEQIQLCWDHLPCCVTDAVERTLSSHINAELEPEAWVQQQIRSQPALDFAIHLYDHLTQENQSDPPQLRNAKRNVWLVAFGELRETFESSCGRGALVNYILNKKQPADEARFRRDCGNLAIAGDRLKSFSAVVGGSGALICGLSIPWTTLTKAKGFENVSPEAISDSVNRENIERCGTQVDKLLTAYETQARACIDSQESPPSRKRKRKNPPARIANIEQATIPLTMADDGLQHVDDTIRLPNQGHSEISAYRPLAPPAGERHPSPARGSGDPNGRTGGFQ
ncbi:hypothetical protein BDP55DRAFT_69048 [Colletotrichum godetiae]|uniref:Uncharacterized protein n=1 Tax=Colletotrichum godetiae TaxID=1209918 RepID=A0AAJ0A927_9PEZI|nr:uncharacterized protein BDP55DRAFT_69048 [Colletotrichum godetiae]KAK1656770.1 hypothetical protein BDP55DRAFT_69048 [Colletotrichum godetiae]